MHWRASAWLLAATTFTAPAANATVALIADGTLTDSAAGHLADLSGLTGTLENGAAANLLGGLGSGIAYAGVTPFWRCRTVVRMRQHIIPLSTTPYPTSIGSKL